MFKPMLGFITGVILLYFSGDLINSSKYSLIYYVVLVVILAFVCIVMLFYRCFAKTTKLFQYSLSFLCLVTGFSYALLSAQDIKSARLSPDNDQAIVELSAYICSLPTQGDFSFSAIFCLNDVRSEEQLTMTAKGYKAKLSWPLDIDLSKGLNRLRVQVIQPKSTVNFIGSAYEASLVYERVVFVGRVQAYLESQALDELSFFSRLRYEYHQARKSIKLYSNSLLEQSSQQGIIQALLLGDKSNLSRTHYKLLSNTGTQHLIAISGLHVGLVMFGLYWLFPKIKLSIVVVISLGFIYIMLVGFSPSAQRAWLMCTCALFYLLGYFQIGKWRVYTITLCLVLVWDPLSTLNLGFWYSFLCVAILFLLSQTLSIRAYPVVSLLVLQLLLLVGMIPIASMLGLKHGVENILANSLAIPWISLLVLPLTLLWFVLSLFVDGLSVFLLTLLNESIKLLMAYLSSLALINIPLMISTQILSVILFGSSFLVLLIFNNVRLIYGMSMLGMVLVVLFPSRLDKLNSQFIVFDVGQGLSLAFQSGEHIWLYDTGPAFSKSSSTDRIILPYLRSNQKTHKLYGLVVSHGDADHAGDISSLVDYSRPELAWTSQPERLPLKVFTLCKAGMAWQRDGLKIEVLYPLASDDFSKLSSNNHSCVVKLTLMGKVFLLVGDLEGKSELALVSHYRDYLKADVLIAGHHGAVKSSSYALLKHVKPEYVIFSSGYMNRFGHPSELVSRRVNEFDVTTYNTAEVGAILFDVDAITNSFSIKTARSHKGFFW